MTFIPLFPLALSGVLFLHASGAVRAVFPPVGFREKVRPADSAAFPASPAHKGGFQFPVKGQDSDSKPAAEKRIADTLHTYARLPVVQQQTVPTLIITALMH